MKQVRGQRDVAVWRSAEHTPGGVMENVLLASQNALRDRQRDSHRQHMSIPLRSKASQGKTYCRASGDGMMEQMSINVANGRPIQALSRPFKIVLILGLVFAPACVRGGTRPNARGRLA